MIWCQIERLHCFTHFATGTLLSGPKPFVGGVLHPIHRSSVNYLGTNYLLSAIMTHASRYRSSSPGSRRLVDPLRASTGTVAAEDFYASPTSYHAYDGYLSPKVAERRGGFFSVDSGDRLEAHPISTKTYRDANHSTKLKTSYAIRPRSQTTTDSSRRPLSLHIPLSTTSSSRKAAVVTSAYEGSASPLPPRASHVRDEPERYISPLPADLTSAY